MTIETSSILPTEPTTTMGDDITMIAAPEIVQDEQAARIQERRINAHSHIKGLGLKPDGLAHNIASGFVGQNLAREAAGLIVDMVKMKKFAGRAVLLAGPPATGKTSISLAVSQELGPQVPFLSMIGTDVFASAQIRKTEILAEAARRCIGLRVREVREVYEGEVISMTPHQASNPRMPVADNDAYTTISHVNLVLRSTKGTKSLKLDPLIYQNLIRSEVRVGDVIFVEASSGQVKRMGRCDAYRTEHDLEIEDYVPLPREEIHKHKEVVQDLSLYDLDLANSLPIRTSANPKKFDIVSLMTEMATFGTRVEVSDNVRSKVDEAVNKFVDQGIAEVIPGVLFIDEAHTMDLECFVFLHKLIESPLSPIIILATNRTEGPVNGTDGRLNSKYCLPEDLLDRLLVIHTKPYTVSEMQTIIEIKAKVEGHILDNEVLEYLAQVASVHSLRYAMLMLAPSKVIANAVNRQNICISDIEQAMSLFEDINAIKE